MTTSEPYDYLVDEPDDDYHDEDRYYRDAQYEMAVEEREREHEAGIDHPHWADELRGI